jgi:arginyl-tRNA--protein-N-Asp/Glu arginylyltransferase
MKYYLDDKLFAVGVVDILPEGLSLVHFFYDP